MEINRHFERQTFSKNQRSKNKKKTETKRDREQQANKTEEKQKQTNKLSIQLTKYPRTQREPTNDREKELKKKRK